ncbi:MAG: HEAT repeat domain-containing protein [Pirellulaceae bacterium]|nr:HEAT repeat domain-containing protein [Pirellulaceae bacterium]
MRSTLLSSLCWLCWAVNSNCWGQAISMTSEPDLIALLSSDVEAGEKAMACKRLAIYGSEAAVPELSKLLADPRLASWARIALEAIPGQQPNDALRSAAAQLDGLLLVGTVNSLGVRRDSQAVELLAGLMRGSNPDVAAAAAVALGKVGTDAAADALTGYLAQAPKSVQSAVAEGCVYCAEHLASSGDTARAIQLYDLVRSGPYPQQRIIEATRGAIVARGADGVPLLVEQLRSPDRRMFALGLQTARQVHSSQLAAELIGEIGKAAPERAALMVEVLGDLSGKPDLKSLLSLSASGSQEVRMAAINVVGRVGDVSCVQPLLEIASSSEQLQPAVRAALVALSDEQVDQDILQRLATAKQGQLLLLELVGLRQLEATDQLIKALASEQEAIRAAALQSLGQTVPQARLSVLITQAVSPQHASDTGAASRALMTAAVRMPDREACAAELGQAAERAPVAAKAILLQTLAAVGGTKALDIIAQHAKHKDESLRDLSTRLLGEWMTIDVAPVLLDLAKTGPVDRFQVRAMRGYIRVARQFVMSDADRAEMCRQALDAAKNVAEQKLVLDVLKRYPTIDTLKLAIGAAQRPGLKEDAKQSIQAIGQKLADNADAQKLIQEAAL